jgi:translation initiation factor 1 (eIF-1/SUI1)
MSAGATKKSNKHLNAAQIKDGDYVQVNVSGDGNCFYRALYNGLKYHTIPGLLTRFFDCVFADNPAGKPANPEAITEEEFWKLVRSTLGAKMMAAAGPFHAQLEEMFTNLQIGAMEYAEMLESEGYKAQKSAITKQRLAILKATKDLADIPKQIQKEKAKQSELEEDLAEAQEIAVNINNANIEAAFNIVTGIQDDIDKSKQAQTALKASLAAAKKATKELPDDIEDAEAELKHYIEVQGATWALYIDAMPREVRKSSLGKVETYLGEAAIKLPKFKEILSNLVASPLENGGYMYASDFDIQLLFSLLENCATPIVYNTIEPGSRIKEVNEDGKPIVHLQLRGEHYNFIVRGDVYKARLAQKRAERVFELNAKGVSKNVTKKNNSKGSAAAAANKPAAAAAANKQVAAEPANKPAAAANNFLKATTKKQFTTAQSATAQKVAMLLSASAVPNNSSSNTSSNNNSNNWKTNNTPLSNNNGSLGSNAYEE